LEGGSFGLERGEEIGLWLLVWRGWRLGGECVLKAVAFIGLSTAERKVVRRNLLVQLLRSEGRIGYDMML
jgi:hypothetical protein